MLYGTVIVRYCKEIKHAASNATLSKCENYMLRYITVYLI